MPPEQSSTALPGDLQSLKQQIISSTEKFLQDHSLRLKTRRLPLQQEELKETTQDGLSDQLPLYHFVTRQKRHMTEQLLRNRSTYRTEYNAVNDERNKHSPFVLKDMPDTVLDHLQKMANDFDDPEFSGVWLSLHTQPFVTDSEFGNLARSKIVSWALIEVLTTNERCLKALWVHPKLGAQATTDLLRGFLPRVVLEAFDLVAPQATDTCSWKFFYSWLNDFDMLPRQTWLILTSDIYFGLPKHCDNLGDNNNGPVGHVDGGDPVGSDCLCQQKVATWDDWDQILVGCTEAFMYKNCHKWLKIIPDKVSVRLKDDANTLPNDQSDKHVTLPKETKEEIYRAETAGIERPLLAKLLKRIYGKWCHGRLKNMEDLLGVKQDDADDGKATKRHNADDGEKIGKKTKKDSSK